MITIGHIDFINTLPLDWEGPAPFAYKKISGPPTKINELLLKGEVDLGVISLAFYLDHQGKLIRLGNLGILSDGPVLSVNLFSQKDLTKARGNGGLKIYETAQSATSVILNRIILRRAYGVEPVTVANRAEAEAVLLIGNQALLERQNGSWNHIYDLGEEWRNLTGFPTVFAVLATHQRILKRKKTELDKVVRFIKGVYQRNKENQADLVGRALGKISLDQKILYKYFECLKYEIGPIEEKAILLFDQIRRE
ncbi:MAG TPA: menaquinone biosynthesis protein [Thermodesulfobacteriota bacterium]|nr:menaquinone biosynthesis protein [Thermodesulfobacteriota bacterium]